MRTGPPSEARPVALTRRAAILAVLAGAACGPAPLSEPRFVRVTGSDTMLTLTRRWAEAFMSQNPGIVVHVQGGGTGAGVVALVDGRADLATGSRPLLPSEVQRLNETARLARGQLPVRPGRGVGLPEPRQPGARPRPAAAQGPVRGPHRELAGGRRPRRAGPDPPSAPELGHPPALPRAGPGRGGVRRDAPPSSPRPRPSSTRSATTRPRSGTAAWPSARTSSTARSGAARPPPPTSATAPTPWRATSSSTPCACPGAGPAASSTSSSATRDSASWRRWASCRCGRRPPRPRVASRARSGLEERAQLQHHASHHQDPTGLLSVQQREPDRGADQRAPERSRDHVAQPVQPEDHP